MVTATVESTFDREALPAEFEEEHLEVAKRLWDGEEVKDLLADDDVHYGQNVLYRLRRIVMQAKSAGDNPAGENGQTPSNNDEPASTANPPARRGRGSQPQEVSPRWVWEQKTYTEENPAPKNEEGEDINMGDMYFFGGDCAITIVTKENPYKVTGRRPTYGLPRRERYDLYKDGMTVNDYRKAGGETYDVEADLIAGHITLSGDDFAHIECADTERDALGRLFDGAGTEEDEPIIKAVFARHNVELSDDDFEIPPEPEPEPATDPEASTDTEDGEDGDDDGDDDEDTDVE